MPPIVSQTTFPSAALRREHPYSIALPDRPAPPDGWPLVMMLHGRGRSHRWVVELPEFPTWFADCPCAVVFPQGDDGWYHDSHVIPGSNYQTMLLEVLAHARAHHPLSRDPARTGIAGWSMGGYGAMRFTQDYPAHVAAVATVIALLDFPTAAQGSDVIAGYPVVFGSSPTHWPTVNCLTRAHAVAGKAMLQIAAVSAYDYGMNARFHARLEKLGIAHDYIEWPGGHEWAVVARGIPEILGFMARTLTR